MVDRFDPANWGYSTVMLAVQRDVLDASLAPVVTTLRGIVARHGDKPVHALAPTIVVDDPSRWTPARDLMSGSGLTDLLATAKERWRAQPHAAAALAWKCYTYWLALPALIGYAGARRVPLPRPDDVLLRHSRHQPFLRLALRHPVIAVLPGDPLAAFALPGRRSRQHGFRVMVCEDDAALRGEMRRALVDDHLEPLLEAIRERVHLGRRTLWGSLASGAAHALAKAEDVVPGPILPIIDEVLTELGVADLVEVTTDPATGALRIARRTCCLAFTLPEPKICTGCCIR
jgi:hypothetical protein